MMTGNEEPTAVCIRCNQTKPLSLFNKHSHKTNGHNSYCRKCDRAMAAEKRAKIPKSYFCSGCTTMKPAADFPNGKQARVRPGGGDSGRLCISCEERRHGHSQDFNTAFDQVFAGVGQ